VDSLTHAFVAAAIFTAAGLPHLVPFAVLGAVILDTDIFFSLFSDPLPTLHGFTHGGYAHSIIGGIVMTVLANAGLWLAAAAGLVDRSVFAFFGPIASAAILAGVFLHIGIDTLASPGIPLLAPFSDYKYSVGLLPGPSITLMIASIIVLVGMVIGRLSFVAGLMVIVVVVCLYLAVRTGSFLLVRGGRCKGRLVPTISPLRWMAISETGDAWTVRHYTLGRGVTDQVVFEKYCNTTPTEVRQSISLPEVKRLIYHSYIITAAKEGDTLVFRDPLREGGYIPYPPHFKRVAVPVGGVPGA
jgi:inner membrane protein